MRARNIKPGFFHNEVLASLPFEARLLFIGLWLLADREGRLEDRPARIKMQIFPSDDVDCDDLLSQLAQNAMILRYEANAMRFIAIPQWSKHQHPHHQEKQSVIPEPRDGANLSGDFKINQSDTGYLIPDTLLVCANAQTRRKAVASRFQEWWEVYPQKRDKKKALKIWKSRGFDEKADMLIEDTKKRIRSDTKWKEGYVPYPTTYLNGDRWEDELARAPISLPAEKKKPPRPETPEERRRNHEKAIKEMEELRERAKRVVVSGGSGEV